jgi:hypothetical protein
MTENPGENGIFPSKRWTTSPGGQFGVRWLSRTLSSYVRQSPHSRSFSQELHPRGPGRHDLEYLLFGKGAELFLAHVITQPPDFDQVLSVQVGTHQFTDEDLLQGVRVVFPGRVNTISNKIKEGEQLLGKVQVVGQDAPGIVDLPVAVGIELYFETEDLADPNTMSMESSGLRQVRE